MKKLDFQYLGEFIKLYSFKGELIFYSEIKSDKVEQLNSIFINFNESYVPFKIVKVKSHKKNIYRVKLEDILSESDAKKFIKKGIYTEKIDNTDNSIVDNFKVYNKDKFIGIVISSYNKTGQMIIEVKMNDKLVLIPFVDDFINQISEDEIYMTLPDGLLDIN